MPGAILVPIVHAIGPFGGETFFGGEFLFAGGVYTPAIARWTGSSWLAVAPGQGVPGIVYDIAIYDGKIAVGGAFPWAGDEPNSKGIALWNGVDWQALGSGVDSSIAAIHVFDGDLIVGGRFLHASGIPASHVARWDGTTWHQMGEGFDGTVFDLVDRAGVLYAAGEFTRSGSMELNHVAEWNGAAWMPLGPGLDETVITLAIHRDTLVAGGNFSFSGSTPVNFIARWDGSRWLPIGDGLNMSVRALATFRGDLIAGGLTTYWAPGMPEPLARWNGSDWERIHGNDSSIVEVNALHVLNDKLFAGGWIERLGGTPVSNVACWDGTAWNALGSGTDHVVVGLGHQGGSLLVGGGFGVAGGKGSAGLAIWDEIPTDLEVHDLRASRTASGVTLSWTLSRSGTTYIVGISVQRSIMPEGTYEERTDSLLDPQETMEFIDRDVENSASYWYRLVVHVRDATSSIVGPVYVEPMHVGASDTVRILQVAQTPAGVRIRYHLEIGPVPVTLGVFDVRGRRIVQLE